MCFPFGLIHELTIAKKHSISSLTEHICLAPLKKIKNKCDKTFHACVFFLFRNIYKNTIRSEYWEKIMFRLFSLCSAHKIRNSDCIVASIQWFRK